MSKYYIQFFLPNRKLDQINRKVFYENLKKDLINPMTYKWDEKILLKLLRDENLSVVNVLDVLLWLSRSTYTVDKGFVDFTDSLNKKREQLIERQSKIYIDEDSRLDFLKKINQLRNEYMTLNNQKFIDFVFSNFDIGLEKYSLERLYYDKKINDKY